MSLEFKPIEATDLIKITPFVGLRPNKACDSVALDSFLWREYYHVQFAISGDKAVQWLMELDGEPYSAMPLCRQEDLESSFCEIVDYFNQVLKKPLRIYLADEEAVQYLNLDAARFEGKEQEEIKDDLYDGEALRTLAGKKLHKKKNNYNAFVKAYEGRIEYRKLCCSDREDVWKFLDFWRQQKGDDVEEHLDYEVRGIHDILKNCSEMAVEMGGVYVDGRMEAFTIGSLNPLENMAVIHIEKANPEMRGLYQYINREFLVHAFPDVALVNREDDMGLEGLRKAKMSYNPIAFARKYSVTQIDF